MRKPLTPEQKAAAKARKRRWYLANRERVLAANQAYREKNPELIARLKKEWADANKEKVRLRRNELRAAAPEKRQQYEAEQRKKPHVKKYQRDYYYMNQSKLKMRRLNYHAANREVSCARMRDYTVRRWLKQAGWSEAELQRRVALGCEICGIKKKLGTQSGLVFDHDHDTGFVRGLLCAKCNQRLDWAIKYYEEIGCYHQFSLEAVA